MKVSTGSAMRRLCSMITTIPDGKMIREKLEKAIALEAVAGHGKSTRIAETLASGDLAVASTNGAVKRLELLKGSK